jgi:hypothetical protein
MDLSGTRRLNQDAGSGKSVDKTWIYGTLGKGAEGAKNFTPSAPPGEKNWKLKFSAVC